MRKWLNTMPNSLPFKPDRLIYLTDLAATPEETSRIPENTNGGGESTERPPQTSFEK